MTEETGKETTEAKQDESVKEPSQDTGKQAPEKTLTQSEVNKLMAEDRRKHDARYQDLKTEYAEYKAGIEKEKQAANDAAAEKVEALRKDLPESITKLLDKLTPVEQLEWLNDPANVITKKEIPPLPPPREGGPSGRKPIQVV